MQQWLWERLELPIYLLVAATCCVALGLVPAFLWDCRDIFVRWWNKR